MATVTSRAENVKRSAPHAIQGCVTHMVRGFRATSCYGMYVIVITWVVGFHWTSSASASATNRRGRSVLPLLMIGTTLALLSIATDLPFSVATFLPIHSSTVVP